jgi:group I intron endonuclease
LIGCEKQDLIKHEQYFIDAFNPWFNICPIAGSSLGRKTPEEVKEKIRQAREHQIMKPMSDETKNKIRIKLRKNHNGEKQDKKTERVIRIAWNKGKKYHLIKKRDGSNYHGYQFTEEQRKAVSDRFKGKKKSPEVVEQMRQRMIGKKYALGAVRTEETKKKISEGMKRLNRAGEGKRVINTLTGEIYTSIGLAAESLNMKYRTLHSQLKGEHKNKTHYKLIA